MKDDLKQRQDAGVRVERKMLEFLMQYSPAQELKVSDVIRIATAARVYAFEEFSALTPTSHHGPTNDAKTREPGTDWKLSEETEAEISEIEKHIRR